MTIDNWISKRGRSVRVYITFEDLQFSVIA